MTFDEIFLVFAVALFVELISKGKPTAPGLIICLAGSFFGFITAKAFFA
jgi:hypothetical protein